jgi:hypothetical protein
VKNSRVKIRCHYIIHKPIIYIVYGTHLQQSLNLTNNIRSFIIIIIIIYNYCIEVFGLYGLGSEYISNIEEGLVQYSLFIPSNKLYFNIIFSCISKYLQTTHCDFIFNLVYSFYTTFNVGTTIDIGYAERRPLFIYMLYI